MCILAAQSSALPAARAYLASARTPPYVPVFHESAVILNSGSTNTTGYRIAVQRNGSAQYALGSVRWHGNVAPALARRFFAHLQSAQPLAALPTSACMKSASFGFSVFVYWNHSRSPDLTCSSGALAAAVFKDAGAIADALHVASALRSRVIRPLMPGEKRLPLPPSPAASTH